MSNTNKVAHHFKMRLSEPEFSSSNRIAIITSAVTLKESISYLDFCKFRFRNKIKAL